MKKNKIVVSIIAVLYVVCGFVFSEKIQAGTEDSVAINESNFPDPAFREYISDNFDNNNDGIIDYDNGYTIFLYNYNGKYDDLYSLKGLEYISKLQSLTCYNIQLENLDVSKNTALKSLDCSNNQLASLDISKNTALTSLNCSNKNAVGRTRR